MEDKGLIYVHAETLPEAWEKSVLQCWEKGFEIPTQYDKPGDPLSKDCFATIVVENPMAEPRIHKAIPAGFEDLEIYRQEVLYGVHDHWIDPENGKWEYSYHARLFNYNNKVDQIEIVIEKLSKQIFTRQAQAITWNPEIDNYCYDPSCLQRMWFRIFNINNELKLNMHIDIRSNDAFKAAFMNMYAFTSLQEYVAKRISENIGQEVKVGRYIHKADSYHIYGSYFDQFDSFVKRCQLTDFNTRICDSSFIQYFFDSGRLTLINSTQLESYPTRDHDIERLIKEIDPSRKSEIKQEILDKFCQNT